MKLEFAKYEGAGNDFVIIDNRKGSISLTKSEIAAICARHTGVGADGLMLLEHSDMDVASYGMRYYNSDGTEAEMCGNGGRCIAMFALNIGAAGREQLLEARDGLHKATILDNGQVSLMMTKPSDIKRAGEGYLIDTGVPHYVEVGKFDTDKARGLRHKYNANVNFVELEDDRLGVRTFERGVENETLACGTGAVASAMVWNALHSKEFKPLTIKALGGDLEVSKDADGNVWLTGGAKKVFEGRF